MEFALTWNLVILSGLVIAFAYNFLLGLRGTIKLILSLYIAILAADGVAGLLQRFVLAPAPGFQELVDGEGSQFFVILRLALLAIATVVLVAKGAFRVDIDNHDHWAAHTGIHAGFAVLSACLLLSTILIYLAGASFVDGLFYAPRIEIYQQSLLARVLIDYYQLWFSLPAIAFIAISFILPKSQE